MVLMKLKEETNQLIFMMIICSQLGGATRLLDKGVRDPS